jgi:tetratricopeptide (TPR) repeat protein
MTEKSDPDMADVKFAKALMFDSSDIYWQARAEAGMGKVSKLVNTAPAVRTASSTEALANQITDTIIKSLSYSRKAVSADPYNYYNHISEARVLEVATSLKMKDAYQNTLVAYNNAVAANPTNPAIYLSLAQFLSSQNKLDEALQAAGKALSIKNNYLDAVFLVSQIQSTKGNINEAITAGQVAVQINPNNPIAYFQLGLLYYYAKNYEFASQAMSVALKLQPDYANAKYFLGLSYARLNKTELAIQQFTELDKANPNNPEISSILSALRAGRSPFADSKASVSANIEKRSSLPIKEKKIKTDSETKI